MRLRYDDKRIAESILVAFEQSCEGGNLRRSPFILESKENDTVVWMFVAKDFLPEILVVRDQDPVFRIGLMENFVVT